MRFTTLLRDNLVPPAGLPRRLAIQNLLTGVGTGTFTTGSAVFFTQVVGLEPHEIGIGLSLGAGVALLAAVPLSAVADRRDPKLTWAVASLGQAMLFATWPLASNFLSFLLLIVTLELISTIGAAGRTVYIIEALDPEVRVRAQAFARSWLNVGWSIGAVLAGIALAINTRSAHNAIVLINAALLIGNAVFIVRLPTVRQAKSHRAPRGQLAVFKDRPFLAVTLVCAVLACHATVVLQVMPLWVLTRTDSPAWMVSVLAGLNTVLATTVQVAVTRGAHTIAGAARALRWSGWAAAACGPVFLLSGTTSGPATAVLLLAAASLVTMAELWHAAGAWTLAADLAPAESRGSYQGAFRMGRSAQAMVAPAALISLAVTTGGWGWLVISGMFLGAAIVAPPIVAWASRAERGASAAAPTDGVNTSRTAPQVAGPPAR